jgi:leucyl aminopeptidase (aminopeptidase T)
MSMGLIQTVRLITDVCLHVSAGENLLCIADKESDMEVLGLIATECRARGAEATLVLIEPRKTHYHEPPPVIAHAMREVDTVIVIAPGSLMHTRARQEACVAGVKYVSLGATTKEYLTQLDLTKEDLIAVRTLTYRIADRLTAASSAHLTARAGTDLHMSLAGRKGLALVPFAKKGSFCLVPDFAEAPCPPIEDSVNGIVVVDGTMVGAHEIQGVVEEPVSIEFEKGRVVNISGNKDARNLQHFLDTIEDVARSFAELGVNSNHKIPKKLWGRRTDNGIAGHVHLGLGRNDHIGGTLKGNPHLDVLVTFATLDLDGVPIVKDGVVLI